MEINLTQIGQLIATHRQRADLSTQQLAERIGKSQATISRIENGKQAISLEVLAAIGRELRVHPFALLTGDPLLHSVLLPPRPPEGGSLYGLVALAAAFARYRAGLSPRAAAEAAGLSEGELQAIELGMSTPRPEAVERLVQAYRMNDDAARALRAQAALEAVDPQLSRVLADYQRLAMHLARHARANPVPPAPDGTGSAEPSGPPPEISRAYRHVFGPRQAGGLRERGAPYYSIAHLSDRLLHALQIHEFHMMQERMAEAWLAEHPEFDAPLASPADANLRDPDAFGGLLATSAATPAALPAPPAFSDRAAPAASAPTTGYPELAPAAQTALPSAYDEAPGFEPLDEEENEP